MAVNLITAVHFRSLVKQVQCREIQICGSHTDVAPALVSLVAGLEPRFLVELSLQLLRSRARQQSLINWVVNWGGVSKANGKHTW